MKVVQNNLPIIAIVGRRNVGKTRVLAPIDGEVEAQIVAVGDYVKVGDPLFHLVGVQRLRARLPLPESAAQRLRPGLRVLLGSPPLRLCQKPLHY